MPHFYFHIRDGEKIIPDEEGLDLLDLEAAMVEGRASASGMLADARADNIDISQQAIEVTDRDGLVLSVIEFRSMAEGLLQ